MRERTTWDRNEIAKQAAGHAKQADPYTMNQPEHAKAQPAADAYVTGTPSSFGEDVHPSSGTWEAEYSGGEVKRNEIGMPEFRGDTFNHAEKTASEEVLVMKAALCVRVARKMLAKTATENMVEDQALSLMHLPDSELISTYSRLAGDDEQQAAEDKQQKQAQEQEQQAQAQEQQKQAQDQEQAKQEQQKQAQQEQDKKDQDQAKQAQDQGQKDQSQQEQKQAGEMPPQFKENAEKKKEEAADKKDEGQDKKATNHIGNVLTAMQQGDMKQAEQALQAAVQQMAQQLMQQMSQQGQPQQQAPMAQGQLQQPTSDDQLLDQMLAEGMPQQQAPMAEDIELDAPSMDVGGDALDPVADAQLMQLFANGGEAQQAEQAKQASAGVRTASTRTVGARPSGGVSRLGGVVAPAPAAGGGRDLSSIWNSSPDVSDVFGIPKS